MPKRVLTGTVVSDKTDKTVVVRVEQVRRDIARIKTQLRTSAAVAS